MSLKKHVTSLSSVYHVYLHTFTFYMSIFTCYSFGMQWKNFAK